MARPVPPKPYSPMVAAGQLDFLDPHLGPVIPAIGPQAMGRGQLAGEHQQQAEGVVGQVLANQALLTGQDDLAVAELVEQQGIHPGGDGMQPTQLVSLPEQPPGDEAQHHVRITDVLIRLGEVPNHHPSAAARFGHAL